MSKNKSKRIYRKNAGLLRCQRKALEAKTPEVRILNAVQANKQPLLSGPQIRDIRVAARKSIMPTYRRYKAWKRHNIKLAKVA